MILYLDASSLVKLYVEEKGSAEVLESVKSAKVVGTSLVAYAEARSAFARRFREKAFGTNEFTRLKSTLDKDWDNYLTVKVTDEVIRLAGDLAEKHGLSGFDSIHLASAVTICHELSVPIVFSCFDEKLQTASGLEGLEQILPGTHGFGPLIE
jgi:predicted nucleic acid-binding protein